MSPASWNLCRAWLEHNQLPLTCRQYMLFPLVAKDTAWMSLLEIAASILCSSMHFAGGFNASPPGGGSGSHTVQFSSAAPDVWPRPHILSDMRRDRDRLVAQAQTWARYGELVAVQQFEENLRQRIATLEQRNVEMLDELVEELRELCRLRAKMNARRGEMERGRELVRLLGRRLRRRR